MPGRIWPMDKGSFTITSPFGSRKNPVTGAQEGHLGLDFAASKGTPFYAAADGVVVEGSERNNVSGFGKWVWLDCQSSVSRDFIYGHGDPAVKKGDRVKAGQLVGYVNSHGQSTGPHLHFESWTAPGRLGGFAVDPAAYLATAKYRLDSQKPGATSQEGTNKLKNPITRAQLSPNRHQETQNISWIAIHTQQGKGKAKDILPFLCNPNSKVSYHLVVDDTETVLNVPLDWCPWSASNANSRAIHVLIAGTFAEWSVDKWLEKDVSDGVNEDLMLTRTAELVAWLGTQYPNVPLRFVGGGQKPPTQNGVCGHMDFGVWGGNHFDPGPKFPWGEFMRRVLVFSEGGTMGFLQEKLKNFKGKEEPLSTIFFYMDKYINEIRDQLVGPEGKGWPQLGKNSQGQSLTLVDSQAEQNKKLDLLLEMNQRLNQRLLEVLQEKK